ncbi:unnamed protein product [Calicophoron daubneyi]|uniref:Cation-transporting ATPase n=1 Tax=Calicophoron daubneyi TaxID=300641 RepID=A0AAV2TPH9_CALDB
MKDEKIAEAMPEFGHQRGVIYGSDGTALDISGYSISLVRSALIYVGYFFTCGILRLLFHWFPHWKLLATHTLCPLRQAQRVLIKDSFGIYYVHQVMISAADGSCGPILMPKYSPKVESALRALRLQANTSRNFITYFFHKKMKYIWDQEKNEFGLLSGWEERPYCELVPASPLTLDAVTRHRMLYGDNEIAIHVTPLMRMLLSECLNPFYCFQAFSCMLWYFENYWQYATAILVISSLSLVLQVIEMRGNEKALKKTVSGSSTVAVCRVINDTAEYQDVDSAELVPGDIIKIPRAGCLMQCDALILSGNCIVNESTLTGESVPVTKTPLPEIRNKHDVFNINSAARHVLFGGTRVIQTRNYADEPVLAVVARTGFRTAKGELVRSILFPKPMKFKFTQDSLKFVAALSVLAAVGFAAAVYLMHRRNVGFGLIVLRALDLITVVVPPALPMAMTVGIIFAQRRLRRHNIYCINPNSINVCGVINVICFDKTGTLTEDGLDLWGVVPSSHGIFEEPEFHPNELESGPLLECMAACHSLTRIEGILSGDPLDLKMFLSTKWEFIEEVSEDHCKFGMAVPAVVRPRPKGSVTNITLESPVDTEALPYEIGILRQFPFTSSLQRMSVIARSLNCSHFSIYTKGAPETIELLCRRDTIPTDFHSVLLEYTRQGYRVLALAWRPLKIPYTRALRIQRERAEQKLQFLGLLIMENRLKPETTPVIEILRDANIRPVMVTGDNMLTAISVARDCEIIDEMDRIVIVSAKPPLSSEAYKYQNMVTGDTPGSGPSTTPEIPFLLRPDIHSMAAGGTTACDSLLCQDRAPLVEFHYAEDLHKPVTEVTATSGPSVRGWRSHLHSSGVPRSSSSRQERKHLFPWLHHRRIIERSAPYTSLRNTSLEEPVDANGATLTSTPQPPGKPPNYDSGNLTSHRVTIRMIDRPDFHLAISGKTWSVIREHYPWLIPKLVVKGTVFARFSPEQKAQLVEALQAVGYFVAMCGDGANDCGALKAAHAGVSLSEAEASVASPFTAKEQNIKCIPTLIRQGRCALVTSFGTFKFMAGYSLVQFTSVVLLYVVGSTMSNSQFLYVDLFLITSLSITFGYTRAYRDLSVEAPRVRLLSMITLMSLGVQLLVNIVIQIGAFFAVRAQPWYLPLFDISATYELENYESTALFTVAAYQYTILAIVFSKGAPYRRSMLSNPFFIFTVLVCLGCTALISSNSIGWVRILINTVRIPSYRFVLLLHGLVLVGFFVCYFSELVVDGLAFRRRLLRIRRALFPRHVQIKDYERIREEIDKLAGSWPPLIRSASVQALPADLFNDAGSPTGVRSRKRMSSALSTDSDEEEIVCLGDSDNPNSSLIQYSGDKTVVNTAGESGLPGPSQPLPSSWQKKDSLACHRSYSFDCGNIGRQTPPFPHGRNEKLPEDFSQNSNDNNSAPKVAFILGSAWPPAPETTFFYGSRHRSQSSSAGGAPSARPSEEKR